MLIIKLGISIIVRFEKNRKLKIKFLNFRFKRVNSINKIKKSRND